MSNPNPERDERVKNPQCPFCKWADISTAYWNGGAWRVICSACNAEGPNALTEAAANEAWSSSANTATRMRDRCVDAIKSLRATPHGAAYNNAINDAIHKVESLTLEGEQEKPK